LASFSFIVLYRDCIIKIPILFFLIVVLSDTFFKSAHAVEIITHGGVTQQALTTSQLRRIYTMRQLHWADDGAITVFVLPSQHSLHKHFSKERLQIFPYQLNRIWHKLTYSGLGVAPIVVNSPEELIQAVSKTPGAIGYADEKLLASLVPNTTNSNTNNKEENRGEGVVHVVKIKD
jgi:ABC-type phosphate transport system substrate-binding protein